MIGIGCSKRGRPSRSPVMGVLAIGILVLGVEALGQTPSDASSTPPDTSSKEKSDAGNDGDAASTEPSGAPPASADRSTDGPTRRPSPEDIIRMFEEETPVDTPVRPDGANVAAGGGAGGTLLREGQYVTERVGYLTDEAPWWVMRFESDSPESPMPPVRLLPNQLLERMIRETDATRERILYVVSGEVTMFDSQNYLLLRKVLRRRTPVNLEP